MNGAGTPHRWACVDLGSNTFRLLVAEETSPGTLRTVALHQQVVRLAEGLKPGGTLGGEALSRAQRLLRRFRSVLDDLGVDRRLGVLAAVGRMARDGPDFACRAGQWLDARIRVVPGHEEARLSALGALSLADPGTRPALCLDIGGGSTELARVGVDGCEWAVSRPVGVVGLWEAAPRNDPPTDGERRALEAQARQAAAHLLDSPSDRDNGVPPALVATAGTPLTVAAAVTRRSIHDTRGLSGVGVSARRLDRLTERFWSVSRAERASWPWVEPGREDVVLAGLALLQAVMSRAGAERLTVSDGGLLEGVLLEAVEGLRGRARWGHRVSTRERTTAPPPGVA